jgi:hypothetical protein
LVVANERNIQSYREPQLAIEMPAVTNLLIHKYLIAKAIKKRTRAKVRDQMRLQTVKSHDTMVARVANSHRNRTYGLEFMKNIDDVKFQRMFRLSRKVFYSLHELIKTDISPRSPQNAINSSGSPISSVAKLAATLRFLAGGSYLDICALFGLDPNNFFSKHYVLWPTIDAIDRAVSLGLSLNPDTLKETSAEFAKFSHGNLNGCIMAIDGWVCKTRQPMVKEVGQDVKAYRNRKSCWAIVVLAGCDARLRFNMVSARSSGSTHDHIIWESSVLKRQLDEEFKNGSLRSTDYYVIGDEAFVCTNHLLTPWSGRNLDPYKDSFNYHLSSMRQCIERAFGLLTQRWGIFWRPLACRFDKWSTIVTVCCKLHNFCIEDDPIQDRHHRDNLPGDNLELLGNSPVDDDAERGDRRPGGHARSMRMSLTQELERNGCLRPSHAFANSRVAL